jgi:hypothetical protein
MTHPVRYYCPHCGAVVELDRDGYLSDKSVTPYPLVGWEYRDPDEAYDAADGVRLVCGEAGLAEDIDGLRTLDAGGLANAAEVESLTPLLINVAQRNEGLEDLGVQFR